MSMKGASSPFFFFFQKANLLTLYHQTVISITL
jgi:hypothetical protein